MKQPSSSVRSDQSVALQSKARKLQVDGSGLSSYFLTATTGYPINNQLASLTIVSSKSVDGEMDESAYSGKAPFPS